MFSKKGLTLVEVIVALALFMIIAVMSFPIITQAGVSNANSRNRLQAQEIGVFAAENIRYTALGVDTKEALIAKIVDTSQGLPDIGVFSRLSDNVYALTTPSPRIKPDTTVTFTFYDDSNRVNIVVTYKKVQFETLEWLNYAT